MPTAAKLVGAISIAALGYAAAYLITRYLPVSGSYGLFAPVSALLGALVGWRFLGRRVGGGYPMSLSVGLGAATGLVASCLIVFAGYEMTVRSLRKAYDGPFEGLQGMIQIAIEDLVYLSYPEVLGTLILGGLLAGLVTEFASRRWL